MPTLLECALAYASIGWHVLPLHNIENGICTCKPTPARPKGGALCGKTAGKHPRIKTGRAFEAATTDPNQIRKWWRRWPLANIGIATGQRSRLCIVDLDGQQGFDRLAVLRAASPTNAVPSTLSAASGRDGIGVHLYFHCDAPSPTNSNNGLDFRGDGGLVVAPPSMHITGRPYRWLNPGAITASMPSWLLQAAFENGAQEQHRPAGVELPPHLQGRQRTGIVARAIAVDRDAVPIDDIWSALTQIPNNDRGWDAWNRIGMAIWAACDGDPRGEDLFDQWSKGSKKYEPDAAAERWRAYSGTPPTSIGFGSLYYEAKQHNPNWMAPSRAQAQYIAESVPKDQQQYQHTNGHVFEAPQNPFGVNGHDLNGHAMNGNLGPAPSLFQPRRPDNPLIELNEKFSVISNLGGKCMVLEWIQSPADEQLKIPSFQSFKAFSERFAHRYVTKLVPKVVNGVEEMVEKSEQLGSHWLKWVQRKTFEALRLDPLGDEILPGNVLNLWRGFGVDPKPGSWALMQRHVYEVLAGGSAEQAAYILRWAAWAVQNPDLQAEVALVFRGGKGTGKGTFAHAMRRLFGPHGLYASSSKRLTGQFNAHLRTCLLLFADEAFWAGDKQGESTLKGLITESVMAIEQKGVDPEMVVNRLHILMAANAEWVVPASHDERRFAVFDVSDKQQGRKEWFAALNDELNSGGLEAMLHDLLKMPLGDWHPRVGLKTAALQHQKEVSLTPIADWWLGMLQDGYMPGRDRRVPASALLHMARESTRKLQDMSPQGLGRFLKKQGVRQLHTVNGTVWEFPELPALRKGWEKQFGAWTWDTPELEAWRVRG